MSVGSFCHGRAVWIVPSSSLLIAMLNGIGAFGFDPVFIKCGRVSSHERAVDLDLILFAVGFPIPVAAVIVSYTLIYIYIKKHLKIQKKNLINFRTTSLISSEISSTLSRPKQSVASEVKMAVTNPRRKQINEQQIEITKNLFVVVCVFFICFAPNGFSLLVDKPSPIGEVIKWYFELLVFANCAINFFIYASRHPDFKVVLGHLMRCSYSKIPQPSRLLIFLLSRNR